MRSLFFDPSVSAMPLSREQRQRIITLYTVEKKSKAEITRLMHCDFNTVSHWIKHWEETGDVRDRPHPGATAKVSTQDKSWIKSKALHSGWDATRISHELRSQRRVDITPRRVQQILNERGARNRAIRKKHPFLPEDKEKRVAWAKKNKCRSWDKVLF